MRDQKRGHGFNSLPCRAHVPPPVTVPDAGAGLEPAHPANAVPTAGHAPRDLVWDALEAGGTGLTRCAPPGVVTAAPATRHYSLIASFDAANSGVLHTPESTTCSGAYRPFMTRNAFTVEIWAPNRQNMNQPACPEGSIPPAPLTRGS